MLAISAGVTLLLLSHVMMDHSYQTFYIRKIYASSYWVSDSGTIPSPKKIENHFDTFREGIRHLKILTNMLEKQYLLTKF